MTPETPVFLCRGYFFFGLHAAASVSILEGDLGFVSWRTTSHEPFRVGRAKDRADAAIRPSSGPQGLLW